MKRENPWFILGAGAIGCLWAAALTGAGKKCKIITRPESIKKYQDLPLIVNTKDRVSRYFVTCASSDKISESISRLVISLKAPDAICAVKSILYAISPDATIIILLNGMGIQDEIVSLLPGRNIWLGSTSDGVWTESPLHIHHAGKGTTWMDQITGQNTRLPFPKKMPYLDIHPCDNIKILLWHKLVINSVINGLSAKYQCKNGDLMVRPEIFKEAKALASECDVLMNRLSISLPASAIEMSVSVMEKTANNFSSTLQDIRQHRLTELPWINGFLITEGKKAGIEMRYHQQLLFELKQMGIE